MRLSPLTSSRRHHLYLAPRTNPLSPLHPGPCVGGVRPGAALFPAPPSPPPRSAAAHGSLGADPSNLFELFHHRSANRIFHRQRRCLASRLSPRHHDTTSTFHLLSPLTSHTRSLSTLRFTLRCTIHFSLRSPLPGRTPRSSLPTPRSPLSLPADPRPPPLPAGGPRQPPALPVHGGALHVHSIKPVLKARLVSVISA
jgi:hypothetical protein